MPWTVDHGPWTVVLCAAWCAKGRHDRGLAGRRNVGLPVYGDAEFNGTLGHGHLARAPGASKEKRGPARPSRPTRTPGGGTSVRPKIASDRCGLPVNQGAQRHFVALLETTRLVDGRLCVSVVVTEERCSALLYYHSPTSPPPWVLGPGSPGEQPMPSPGKA